MTIILIDFFDRRTEKHIDEVKIDVPDDLVFEAAQSTDISYINARPFDVSSRMIEYIIKERPELKEKFDHCIHEFIGRHGLGPEYD